jgi:serine/threonine-protein kinase
MALQPGEIIDGKYRIIRLVGEGGMGAVYEGENTRIKRTVAIKVLHSAVAEKVDVVQRFEREAQAAGRIGSEHIVEVLDLGNLPSQERFMVMEFLEGEDLTARIKKRKRLTPAESVPIMHQVLEGLGAAHEAGIIHRDLKPDNIYILNTKAGRPDFVKILDFGVSKFSALDNEMSMTRTGAVMGTPYYMSPEQAKGGKVDNRSDLYAMGVVLYQMITGRVPFNASSFNELLFKIALESPEPVETIVPDCPPAFVALVNQAMSRDPSQRFQTARGFQEALAKWQMTAAPAVHAATQPLPAMADMRGHMGSHPGQLQPGLAQSGLAQSDPALHAANMGLLHTGPSYSGPSHGGPSHGGPSYGASHTGPHPAQMGHMHTPMQQTPIPGTNPALGLSQSALALTPQPKPKGGLVVALVAVSLAIVGVGVAGAWVLTRPGETVAPAATSAPEDTAAPDESAAPETAGDPDDSAAPDDLDTPPTETATADDPPPDETATPVVPVVPKPVAQPLAKPKPIAQPPKPAPPAPKDDPPKPTPKPKGRDIKTTL